MTLEEFEAIFKERDEAKSPDELHAQVVRSVTAKNLRDLEKLYGPPQVPPKQKTQEQKTNSKQIAGDHYQKMEIQPWAAMEAWLSPEEFRGYLIGNSLKYLARAGKKGDYKEDIQKAHHYLEKLLEMQ